MFDRKALIAKAESEFGDCLVDDVEYVQGFDNLAHDASMADFDIADPDRHFSANVLPGLFRKNADWEGEREFRLVLRGQDSHALLPVGEAVVGLVAGVDFSAHRLPILIRTVEHLGIEDSVGQLHVSDGGFLDLYPMQDLDGDWHVWTDSDLRSLGVVFDES